MRQTIRMDRLLAVPYAILRLLFASGNRRVRKDGPVVVIKLFGMGSLIRFAEVLDQYQVKREEIYLVTLDSMQPVADLLGLKVVLFSARNVGQLPGAFWKTMKAIRVLKPRIVIDLERASNGVGILRTLSSNGALEVGLNPYGADRIRAQRLIFSLQGQQVSKVFHRMFDSLGFIKTESRIQNNVQSNTTLLINLNASDYLPERKYPAEKFELFVREWNQIHPTSKFIFTGTAAEKPYVDTVLNRLDGLPVVNAAGQWNLEEFTRHLAHCALLVSNDSGPMHLAHYLGTPTIAIWGPTHPGYVGYPDSDRLQNLWIEKACSPCFEHPKSSIAKSCSGRVDCLQELPVSRLLEAAEKLWSAPADRLVNVPPGLKRTGVYSKEVIS